MSGPIINPYEIEGVTPHTAKQGTDSDRTEMIAAIAHEAQITGLDANDILNTAYAARGAPPILPESTRYYVQPASIPEPKYVGNAAEDPHRIMLGDIVCSIVVGEDAFEFTSSNNPAPSVVATYPFCTRHPLYVVRGIAMESGERKIEGGGGLVSYTPIGRINTFNTGTDTIRACARIVAAPPRPRDPQEADRADAGGRQVFVPMEESTFLYRYADIANEIADSIRDRNPDRAVVANLYCAMMQTCHPVLSLMLMRRLRANDQNRDLVERMRNHLPLSLALKLGRNPGVHEINDAQAAVMRAITVGITAAQLHALRGHASIVVRAGGW